MRGTKPLPYPGRSVPHGPSRRGEHVNLYTGINNLFDQKPAFGYDSNSYFYAGAKMNLGAAGR